MYTSVVDPGFPRGGGANPQSGGANLLFGQNSPKNCIKMKDFGPGQGHASLAFPLDPPMHVTHDFNNTEISFLLLLSIQCV